MKKADLEDMVIMQDTTQLAFDTFKEYSGGDFIPKFICPFIYFSAPALGTLSICINVCLGFKQKKELAYLKYVN